jgi:uncharacterized protein YegL
MKKKVKKSSSKSTKKTPAKPAKAPAKKVVKKLKVKKVETKANKTYISLILDCSGSMETIRAETIEHFNEQIEQIIKDSKDLETRISLVTFNNEADIKFFNQPLSKLKPLTLQTYVPNGYTAMYDAIGSTLDRMTSEIGDINDKNVAALVVILSDGQENNSKKYSAEDIATKIKLLQGTDRWTFSYLGANQDLSEIQKRFNIPKGNISAFVASSSGMKRATAMSVGSTSRYLGLRSAGITYSNDYYGTKQ